MIRARTMGILGVGLALFAIGAWLEGRGDAPAGRSGRGQAAPVAGPGAPPAAPAGGATPPAAGPASPAATPASDGEVRARAACVGCHAFAPPDVLPRFAWRDVIAVMDALSPLLPAERDAVLAWYERAAPERLPLLPPWPPARAEPLRFERRALAPPGAPPLPAIANVRFLDIAGDARPELVACDMRHGLVLVASAGGPLAPIARVPHPAHAEAADLDEDGERDLVVADLGSFEPADHARGAVVWLRGRRGAPFEVVTLARGLGRVADVEPADLDGDGDRDLVVAEFGWRKTGSLFALENTGGGAFERRPIDARHGAIHAPAADLDGDGRLDVVALFAQEHEAVIAFLNRGGFRFEARELFRAPHPAWGMSGLALADLDRDGDLDVLVTNGDTLDDHNLKPYHGVEWLENRGALRFERRPLAPLYAAHRAEAADLDLDGDLDIVACAFLPQFGADVRAPLELASIVVFEQTAPRTFAPRPLEKHAVDHATLALGDWDGDGDPDLAVGNMTEKATIEAWVDVWENRAR